MQKSIKNKHHRGFYVILFIISFVLFISLCFGFVYISHYPWRFALGFKLSYLIIFAISFTWLINQSIATFEKL